MFGVKTTRSMAVLLPATVLLHLCAGLEAQIACGAYMPFVALTSSFSTHGRRFAQTSSTKKLPCTSCYKLYHARCLFLHTGTPSHAGIRQTQRCFSPAVPPSLPGSSRSLSLTTDRSVHTWQRAVGPGFQRCEPRKTHLNTPGPSGSGGNCHSLNAYPTSWEERSL